MSIIQVDVAHNYQIKKNNRKGFYEKINAFYWYPERTCFLLIYSSQLRLAFVVITCKCMKFGFRGLFQTFQKIVLKKENVANMQTKINRYTIYVSTFWYQ